jgi:hypothetical protein
MNWYRLWLMRWRAITLDTSSENNDGALANPEGPEIGQSALKSSGTSPNFLNTVAWGPFKFPDWRVEGSAGSLISRETVMTSAPFEGKPRFAESLAFDSGSSMPVKLCASTILGAFEEARSELSGKAVVLTDGKAGTVENIWLDELHGLRISIRGHAGKWPISTIKFAQS